MPSHASSSSLTVLSDGGCARSCASRRSDPGSGAVPTIINAGQMRTSQVSDCSHYPQPAIKRDAPDEETNDWRAVCGRTASTVRREGRRRAFPTPIVLFDAATKKTWMPGIADKFTQSAQGRLLWPGMTKEESLGIAIMTIRFDGRVAIVTGAGNGLGRAHALGLASRGAKVVVNDFGGARDGTGGSLTPAQAVVEEIRKAGGVAMADGADVSDFEQVTTMVERATREWGSVDLLCANAGILRDKSFGKMEPADFAKVLDVHLVGTFYCCKAVWNGMRERNYGRIVLTTSSSGLYGNFGQANYGAAKSGMIGLMNVLADGGHAHDGRVAAAPGAGIDEARGDHAGGGISPERGRADPHHHGRGRRLVRRDQDTGERRH